MPHSQIQRGKIYLFIHSNTKFILNNAYFNGQLWHGICFILCSDCLVSHMVGPTYMGQDQLEIGKRFFNPKDCNNQLKVSRDCTFLVIISFSMYTSMWLVLRYHRRHGHFKFPIQTKPLPEYNVWRCNCHANKAKYGKFIRSHWVGSHITCARF